MPHLNEVKIKFEKFLTKVKISTEETDQLLTTTPCILSLSIGNNRNIMELNEKTC
jgi:hypothetical protein